MIEDQEIGLKIVLNGAPESGWSSSDSSWQCYKMLETTTKPFQVLGLWLHLKEMFFLGLGLMVTERLTSKKY